MKYYRMLLKKPSRDFVRMSSHVLVGERSIQCAHFSNAQPTVVFENGYCAGMSCMKYWDSAFLELSQTHSVFAYDRVDEVLAESEIEDIPQHLEKTATLLRTLLESKGLHAPYILVGHSLGGLYMQYFAKKYPDEVASLVLVDAVYPSDKTHVNVIDTNIDNIGQAVLQMPSFGELPMSILSATKEEHKKESCEKMQMIDESISHQKAYAKLYPHATQIWVDSGHLIQYEKPEAIIKAVKCY